MQRSQMQSEEVAYRGQALYEAGIEEIRAERFGAFAKFRDGLE